MSGIYVYLREDSGSRWRIYSPSGAPISGIYYLKGRINAEEWGKAYISCWPEWKLIVEEYPRDKKD